MNGKKRFEPNNKYFTICIYTFVTFLACAIVAKMIFSFSGMVNAVKVILGVLVPFIAGVIIAYLINPLFKLFDHRILAKAFKKENQRGLRKTLSLVIAYIIVLGFVIIVVAVIIPQFAASILSLIDTIKNFLPEIQTWIDNIQSTFNDLNFEPLSNALENMVPALTDFLKSWSETLVSGVLNTVVGVVSGFVQALLAIIVSIYVLSDKERLERGVKRFIFAIFNEKRAQSICTNIRECSTIFSNYFTGKIIDSLLVGIATFLLMVICGLPYALLVSVFVFITNIIPTFGPIVGAVIGCLIMLMTGWKELIIFLVIDLVLQQIDGNIVGPKIIGNTTGIRPVWVLFGVTVGAWAAGFAGMLFGVPVMAIIAHLVNKWVNRRLVNKGLGEMAVEKETPTTISYGDMFKRFGSKIVFVRKWKEKRESKNNNSKDNKSE